jgi:histidinol-phosphate aminotransferase
MSYFRPNIEQMAGYEPGFQPREPGYVKLNTNESPYAPSPRVVEALKAACGEGLRKYPDPMADPLRRQAADLYGTVPERLLCGNGSDDLLNIALRSFCGEGDAVAYPSPTYSLYPTLAKLQGARGVAVPFPEDYALPAGLAETGARLTVVANPNAPTGTVLAPQRLAELAAALDGVLLVDEAYVDFAEEHCLDLVDEHANVVVLRTLSKSYSLAGLRVGLAVAQEPLIEGMTKVKDSYNLDALAIVGATAALADQEWLARNVARIKATRRRLTDGLEALGFRCYPSQANFVLARAPKPAEARSLYERLLERKILVRYFAAPRLEDCLRISVGADEEVDALLAALREILAAPVEKTP